MLDNIREIRELLDDSGSYTEVQVLDFMNFLAINYHEFHSEGGMNPAYKDRIESFGIVFDHVNGIVKTVLNQ